MADKIPYSAKIISNYLNYFLYAEGEGVTITNHLVWCRKPSGCTIFLDDIGPICYKVGDNGMGWFATFLLH